MLLAAAIGSLGLYGHDPLWFLITGGLVYFTWGEIYSLFPAACTDSYGSAYATTNAGMLYTAKGTAALLVPLANVVAKSGDWTMVLCVGAAANIVAALMAVFVLRPMRKAHRIAQRVDFPFTLGDTGAHIGDVVLRPVQVALRLRVGHEGVGIGIDRDA